MTETKNVEFTPEQQAKVDEIVKARVAREREKWEKESGTEDLRSQLEAKEEEISRLKQEHRQNDARRAVLDHLASIGVQDHGRQERIMKYISLDEVDPADRMSVAGALTTVKQDLPELLTERVVGTGSGGSKRPVVTEEKPLTREELEQMNPEQINTAWDRVQRFLSGERS